MTIHKEGYKPIIISFIVVICMALLFMFSVSEYASWNLLVYGSLVAVFAWIVMFFRLPSRTFTNQQNKVVSPADGTIVSIEEIVENEFFRQPMRQISVFMSPFNVHANWYPVSGHVVYKKYHSGKFLVAWHPKSSTLNERMTIAMKTQENQDVLIRQVAGVFARRIICYSQENQQVTQGQELGFIRFGSRVDVFLPLGSEVLVQMGDKVKGGVSTLALLQ